jgi:hypothetical protein
VQATEPTPAAALLERAGVDVLFGHPGGAIVKRSFLVDVTSLGPEPVPTAGQPLEAVGDPAPGEVSA